MIEEKCIKVSAGVIERTDGKILLTSRKLANGTVFWEFPGGKIENGETPGAAARRELAEELALTVYPADTMYKTLYKYPDKVVELWFVRCFCFDLSEMKMVEDQQYRWVDVNETEESELLAADKDFFRFLRLRTIKN